MAYRRGPDRVNLTLKYRLHRKLFEIIYCVTRFYFFIQSLQNKLFAQTCLFPNYREFFKSAEISADYSLIYFDKLGLINLLKSNLWNILANENAGKTYTVRYRIFYRSFIKKSWFIKISNLKHNKALIWISL